MNAELDFDPKKAATWNEREHAVYETGHEEGRSCNAADWAIALGELTSLEEPRTDGLDEWSGPWEIAAYIARLEAEVARLTPAEPSEPSRV